MGLCTSLVDICVFYEKNTQIFVSRVKSDIVGSLADIFAPDDALSFEDPVSGQRFYVRAI